MERIKDKPASSKGKRWVVIHEWERKTFMFFNNEEDVIKCEGIMTVDDYGFVVTPKSNEQLKNLSREINFKEHDKNKN